MEVCQSETDVLRRRLKKALLVVDKFKQKYQLEQEVNKELARRNDQLRLGIDIHFTYLSAAYSLAHFR